MAEEGSMNAGRRMDGAIDGEVSRGDAGMTAPLVAVVVPYSRFLECQDRRRQFAAGLVPPDHPPTVDGDITVAAENAAVVHRQG
jgi:hypothetical protein